jgi:hypothetical protein
LPCASCPPWCTLSLHFADGEGIDADDGYHHCGPQIAVPASYRMHRDAPETVVRAILKSWTHPLDAEPGPALIEINLGTAGEWADACAEITHRCGAIDGARCPGLPAPSSRGRSRAA